MPIIIKIILKEKISTRNPLKAIETGIAIWATVKVKLETTPILSWGTFSWNKVMIGKLEKFNPTPNNAAEKTINTIPNPKGINRIAVAEIIKPIKTIGIRLRYLSTNPIIKLDAIKPPERAAIIIPYPDGPRPVFCEINGNRGKIGPPKKFIQAA